MIQNNIVSQNIWFEIFELTNNTLQNTKDIFQKYIRTLTHNKSVAKENIKEIVIRGKPVKARPHWNNLSKDEKAKYLDNDNKSFKMPNNQHHMDIDFNGATIDGDFDISYNKFKETDDCFKNNLPVVVKGNVYLNHNKLTTLKGINIEVYGDFYCHDNAKKLDNPDNEDFRVLGRFINE